MKHYTKEALRYVAIIILGFSIILASLFMKYKPVYAVTFAGKEQGIVKDINDFKKQIDEEIDKNIAIETEKKFAKGKQEHLSLQRN